MTLQPLQQRSENLADAVYVQELFMNDYFRIYTNDDVIGVETGAALKNIIALGAGAIHGLGFAIMPKRQL